MEKSHENFVRRHGPEQGLEEEVFEVFLEAALLEAEYVDEGTEGIILKLNLNELTPEARRGLVGQAEIPELSAVKLIKIHRIGIGEKEFEAQQAAHQALSGHEDDAAQVPEPYIYRKINIKSEKVLKHLADECGYQGEKQAEVFIMDFVEGEDLYTFLLKEVARLSPVKELDDVRASIDRITLSRLEERVFPYAGLGRIVGLAPDEKELAINKNVENLHEYLAKIGFKLSPHIREKIEKSLDILERQGIFHRDLHIRNIMLGKEDQVYLIDFGKSYITGRDIGPVFEVAEGVSYIKDKDILLTLKTLEELEPPPEFPEFSLDELYKIISNKKEKQWQEYLQAIQKDEAELTVDDIAGFVASLETHPEEISRPKATAAIMLELVKHKPDLAVDYIKFREKEKRLVYKPNQMEKNVLDRIKVRLIKAGKLKPNKPKKARKRRKK